MTINASHVPYDLDNFRSLLSKELEDADLKMTSTMRETVAKAARDDGEDLFVRRWQLPFAAGCQGAIFTIGELCDSYVNEVTTQVILPKSVSSILFGRDGLIRRTGSGSCPVLLQDIQVGFVKDISSGEPPLGPIIISGRNRLVAIQAFLLTAIPSIAVRDVRVRCLAYTFTTRNALEDAIVAANSGRAFPASEKREKKTARDGLDLSTKESIRASLRHFCRQPDAGAVVGAWLKLAASEQGLNGGITAAQLADAGAALSNRLAREHRPEGGTLGKWFKADTSRLIRLCEQAEQPLEHAMRDAANDTSAGRVSKKIADRLYLVAASAVRS